MNYISVKDAAKKWNISERSVRNYCAEGRVKGAVLVGKTWMIPDDAEKELEWFSYFDINPSRSSPEKRTDLALFEQKGGKINYTSTGSMKKYDDLAARLLADDPPDMFWYETAMTFPANCIKGMFQPVDPIVDFDSPIWSDVKETAEQYTMNGEHYVAPVDFGALSVMTYNVDVFEENSLDDPYELYQEGK